MTLCKTCYKIVVIIASMILDQGKDSIYISIFVMIDKNKLIRKRYYIFFFALFNTYDI